MTRSLTTLVAGIGLLVLAQAQPDSSHDHRLAGMVGKIHVKM